MQQIRLFNLNATKMLIFSAIIFMCFDVQAQNQIAVKRLNYNGDGCAQGSVAAVMSPDNSSFSILFDNFNVEASGAATRRVRRSCTIEVDMTIPVGYQLELPSVDYRGFVQLSDSESLAMLKSTFYFAGGSVIVNGHRLPGGSTSSGIVENFSGPTQDNFVFTALIGNSRRPIDRNMSRCNGSARLRVDSQVVATVRGRAGNQSSIVLDSVDGNFAQRYNLALAPCDPDNVDNAPTCRGRRCPGERHGR